MSEKKQILESACKNFEEDLVLYYYGEGPALERQRIEIHIVSCSRCRRFLDDLQRILPQVAQPAPLPQSFWDDYYSETVGKIAARHEPTYWWRDFLAPLRAWFIPAFATAAVAVLAVALLFGKVGWNDQAVRSRAALPQEVLADADQLEFFNAMDVLESLPVLEALDGAQPETSASRKG